mmetsp:Transcript_31870/g.105700  ORF Transcript_31870/g.105700 Transcript_31870/m.105700 type:complete len:200 (-) Transcript_31870:598-1197(-)
MCRHSARTVGRHHRFALAAGQAWGPQALEPPRRLHEAGRAAAPRLRDVHAHGPVPDDLEQAHHAGAALRVPAVALRPGRAGLRALQSRGRALGPLRGAGRVAGGCGGSEVVRHGLANWSVQSYDAGHRKRCISALGPGLHSDVEGLYSSGCPRRHVGLGRSARGPSRCRVCLRHRRRHGYRSQGRAACDNRRAHADDGV